jgi:hypothetical protein
LVAPLLQLESEDPLHTLMPYKHYGQCAEVLTDMHLLNQCDMVASTLAGSNNDTPLPGMWKGYLFQLVLFGMRMSHEANIERDLRWHRWRDIAPFVVLADDMRKDMPPWWGDPWVHRSHRSRLLNLSYMDYQGLWPGTPLLMPVVWPQLTDEDERGYRLVLSKKDAYLVDKGSYRLPEGLRWNGKELLST